MTPVAVAGEVTYAFDPEAIRFEPSRIFTEHTYVAFEGATAYGDAIEDSVSRHEPQLAGERSLSRGDHDRVRRADEGHCDRRRRQVRRRHARRLPAAAHRRPHDRAGDARVGRDLGRRRRRLRRRELVCVREPRLDSLGPVAHGRDGAVLARLPARRRRRRDSTPASASRTASCATSGKRSTCRTTTSTARCRAISTSTAPTRGRTASAA